MNEPDWIDAKTACAALGVKAQTLYAYVSRHQISAMADPGDSRHSLYSRRDIDVLAQQNRRPRARADVAQAAIRWGDPVLLTAISEVRDGTIWLRGQRIEDCASTMTLEQVAALLSGLDRISCPTTFGQPAGTTPFARAMKALALETETAQPMLTQAPPDIAQEAGRMISVVADACLGQRSEGPIHERVARAWGLDGEAQDMLRQALVLLSEHELNPSTFAVRVCASTGASLPAALLSGMATLSGPRHGGVAGLTQAALTAVQDGSLEAFLSRNSDEGAYGFGFGHPLYPDGDPRAAFVLRQIPENTPAKMAVTRISERLALAPNIDAALAVLTARVGGPQEGATMIFSIGRVVGWIAHAFEQVQGGDMIRPRAKFQPRR